MTNKPNIIYVLADDMGYGDISRLNGNSKINTRNLDQLAGEGLCFTDAHASSAVCTPSRYSILTGRYCWRSSLKENVTFGYDPPVIEPARMTVASYLKNHGYNTACFGKWHLGMDWQRCGNNANDIDFTQPIKNGPNAHGFDYFFGISASLDMPPYAYIENARVTRLPDHITHGNGKKTAWREGVAAPDFHHDAVMPELTRRVIEYIRRQAVESRPFFLYFPLTAPHTPILPTPEFQGKSGTNTYGDFCLQVDHVMGQIMAELERCKIKDDTILIFTSDNGCSPNADFEELAKFNHNPSHIFRGAKADIFEGGHRIPLIVRWPNGIAAAGVCDQTVCLTDLLATCADLMDDKLPDNAGEDSVSNLPLWRGGVQRSPLREATVHHSIDGSFSIRQGRWKLEMCPGSGGWSHPRPGQECTGLPPVQLYDLSRDVAEQVNLCERYPEVVARLKTLLTQYVKNGRSTAGKPQKNTGVKHWPQLNWLTEEEL